MEEDREGGRGSNNNNGNILPLAVSLSPFLRGLNFVVTRRKKRGTVQLCQVLGYVLYDGNGMEGDFLPRKKKESVKILNVRNRHAKERKRWQRFLMSVNGCCSNN